MIAHVEHEGKYRKMCLKIPNVAGEILSLAGDDSAGSSKTCIRFDVRFEDRPGGKDIIPKWLPKKYKRELDGTGPGFLPVDGETFAELLTLHFRAHRILRWRKKFGFWRRGGRIGPVHWVRIFGTTSVYLRYSPKRRIHVMLKAFKDIPVVIKREKLRDGQPYDADWLWPRARKERNG